MLMLREHHSRQHLEEVTFTARERLHLNGSRIAVDASNAPFWNLRSLGHFLKKGVGHGDR
jgi:hypothetical protein